MFGDLHSKTGKSSDVEKIPLIFGSGRSVYKMDRYVNTLLLQAAADGGSDLFLVAEQYPSYRLHGEVVRIPGADRVIAGKDVDTFRKKILSAADEELYGKIGTFDCSYALEKGSRRFRLNFYTTGRGSALVARIVTNGAELDFSKLHLPEIFGKLCLRSRGLILIAGSTGSGKTTTLGAMINTINENVHKHILTLEDPIEIMHESKNCLISQREIDASQGGFAPALRGALRENPDVIVVGEMRDAETAQTAINAALTGHLVISTVHISNTVQSVERIINLFPEEQKAQVAIDLSMALLMVAGQRLLPRQDGTGMVPAVEILLGTPTAQKSIEQRDYTALEDVLDRGRIAGMISFKNSIFELYKQGIVSLEDAMDCVDNPAEFDLLVRGMDRGADSNTNCYSTEMNAYDSNTLNMRFLLKTALRKKASDLHLSYGSPPILRVNGDLSVLGLPRLRRGDIEHLLYSVISPRQRVELEQKRELDFALNVHMDESRRTKNRFRINAFYQRGHLGMVARVIRNDIPSPEDLKLPEILQSLICKKQGLILVTGPTGSGKSTTLGSLINQINQTRSSKIITVEDPIEYLHRNQYSVIEQRELHADTLSFASALKYALRQDPDVIMVGEMRDLETIGAVLTAAETGHLVFATIHTNNAPQTIDRIVDSFPSHQQNQIRLQLAGVLLAVVSQRLLPLKHGEGRVGAFEVMVGTPPVQALIRDGKTFQLQSIMETGARDGMITMEKYIRNLYDEDLIGEECLSLFQADYKFD